MSSFKAYITVYAGRRVLLNVSRVCLFLIQSFSQ